MATLRTTRRREAPRPVVVAGAGLATVLVVGLLALAALRSPDGLPLVAYRDLAVAIDDPGNLQAHNDVRINGVRVGQVLGLDRTNEGRASVRLRLERAVDRLPVDTQVTLRGNGLLGARYVELKPGTSPQTVPDGGTLATTGDVLTYGVPDALNTLDPRARESLSTGVRELGATVLGRGRVFHDATAVSPQVGVDLKRIFAAPLRDAGAAERLLPSMTSATEAFNSAAEDIARGLPAARRALQPFADRSENVARTLDVAPGALAGARLGLDRGTQLIAAAGSVARAANRTLPRVPAGLRATTALLRGSPRPLRRANTLLARASVAIPPTLKAVSALSPLLRPVQRLADDLMPVFDRLAPRACDLDNFAENWRSMLGFGVPRQGQSAPLPSGDVGGLSHLRVTVLVDSESIEGASRPATDGISETYPAPCASSPGPVYSQTAVGP